MRERINGLRRNCPSGSRRRASSGTFPSCSASPGCFHSSGLSVEQVRRLREEFSIYTVDSARVNVASFNDSNIDYFIESLKAGAVGRDSQCAEAAS